MANVDYIEATGSIGVAHRHAAPDAAAVATVRRARRQGHARRHRVGWSVVVVAVVTLFATVILGKIPVALSDLPGILTGETPRGASFVVTNVRLPRALTGLFAGAAFGMSGAVFQTLARNPLASPDIIGVNAGASFGAVVAVLVLDLPSSGIAALAMAGALGVAVLIYALALRDGGSSYRLVLVGIGIAAVLGAATSLLMTRAALHDVERVMHWLVGSLNARGWNHVVFIGVALALLTPALMTLGRPLAGLQLGVDTATCIGIATRRTHLRLVSVAVLLAAMATAVAGPVAFVAFMAPPIARRLAKSPGPLLIPSGLVGGALLIVADLVGRVSFGEINLPVGVVTGLLGAPYLVWLLARADKVGTDG